MNNPHVKIGGIGGVVFENEHEASFIQGQVQFSVKMTDLGELEIYITDGRIVMLSRHDNVIRIRREPTWDDGTTTKILAHVIQKGGKAENVAQECVNIMRGRDR